MTDSVCVICRKGIKDIEDIVVGDLAENAEDYAGDAICSDCVFPLIYVFIGARAKLLPLFIREHNLMQEIG